MAVDSGRSWFPGYAIDVTTGERLNICFGESSWLIGENGRDMIWNPTGNVTSPLDQLLIGGKHHIYVQNTLYDEGNAAQAVLQANHNNISVEVRDFYNTLMWVGMAPMLSGTDELLSMADGIVPTWVKVRLRVSQPYSEQYVDGSNDSLPKYTFSTVGLGADTGMIDVAENALDLIRVVPNPYYAYSGYETNQLDNRVKITNLPNRCTVSIFTLDGVLIRKFTRAFGGNSSEGSATEVVNSDNSIDWDLKNSKNISISSGLYIIHVQAEGVGEKTLKWFGVLRPIDLDTF